MSIFSRYLSIALVALLALQPVMACCAMADMGFDVEEKRSSMPCHETQASKSTPIYDDIAGLSGSTLSPMDCCAPAFFDVDANAALGLSPSPGKVQLAAADTLATGAWQLQWSIIATGPPPPLLLAETTPVSLKQRLLN